MAQRFKIMSVDDEVINQQIIEEILHEDYDVELLYSGEDCIKYIEESQPNLILMDVAMPGLDGFETCEMLKAKPSTKNIPVIFLSALSSTSERLAGYEVGGSDYIVKPYDSENLLKKIEHNLRNAQTLRDNIELLIQLRSSNSSAVNALNYTHDLSLVIRFYENIENTHTLDELVEQIFVTSTEIGIRCTVQIHTTAHDVNFSDIGVVTPVELQLIEQHRGSQQFFELNSYLIVNYPNISLLTKNMPDKENLSQRNTEYQKLQETIRALTHAANNKLNYLRQA